MKTEYKSEILDQADLKLLGHLRTNARETLTRISQETQIPVSSIFDRLKRMEKMNVIKRFTCVSFCWLKPIKARKETWKIG